VDILEVGLLGKKCCLDVRLTGSVVLTVSEFGDEIKVLKGTVLR
jgi:hypothetical protein